MAENNLKPYINDFFNDLELYDDYKNGHNYKDLLHASVIRFLDYENTYTAYDIYENCIPHIDKFMNNNFTKYL